MLLNIFHFSRSPRGLEFISTCGRLLEEKRAHRTSSRNQSSKSISHNFKLKDCVFQWKTPRVFFEGAPQECTKYSFAFILPYPVGVALIFKTSFIVLLWSHRSNTVWYIVEGDKICREEESTPCSGCISGLFLHPSNTER